MRIHLVGLEEWGAELFAGSSTGMRKWLKYRPRRQTLVVEERLYPLTVGRIHLGSPVAPAGPDGL